MRSETTNEVDDLELAPVRPMEVKTISTIQPVIPALIRKPENPVLGLHVVTEGHGGWNELSDLDADDEDKVIYASVLYLSSYAPVVE